MPTASHRRQNTPYSIGRGGTSKTKSNKESHDSKWEVGTELHGYGLAGGYASTPCTTRHHTLGHTGHPLPHGHGGRGRRGWGRCRCRCCRCPGTSTLACSGGRRAAWHHGLERQLVARETTTQAGRHNAGVGAHPAISGGSRGKNPLIWEGSCLLPSCQRSPFVSHPLAPSPWAHPPQRLWCLQET